MKRGLACLVLTQALAWSAGGCDCGGGGGPATPQWPEGSALTVSVQGPTRIRLAWPAAEDDGGVMAYRVMRDSVEIATLDEATLQLERDDHFPLTTYGFTIEAVDADGNVSVEPLSGSGTTTSIPDPASVATALDRTAATHFADATAFLYAGPSPVQVGADPAAFTRRRQAVVRGVVVDAGGAALGGVEVAAPDHPEYGKTFTREDGAFDLAVNGGGLVTLRFRRQGWLTSEREVDAPWQDYVGIPEVRMKPLDGTVTEIDLSRAEMQVATGGMSVDGDGARRALVLFPAGTGASLLHADGTNEAIDVLHVRATEYTTGPDGAAAMPGELPAQSAYTYAVDVSVDEAEAAGALGVEFDREVILYVDNFIGFPVGGAVPNGYYDRRAHAWVAARDGRVVEIISAGAGGVTMDVDGDGAADTGSALDALGVTGAELEALASLVAPGDTLWRVPVTHFSPWDCNWPFGLPLDAIGALLDLLGDLFGDLFNDTCAVGGSIIACETQTLGEGFNVVGTSFALHYQSNRVAGRRDAYRLRIPLTPAVIPSSLRGIRLEIDVAGQRVVERRDPAPSLIHTFEWNGRDAYGRELQGSHPITVRLGYEYEPQFYERPADFDASFGRFATEGTPGASPVSFSREGGLVTLWQVWAGSIGPWSSLPQGLGGWNLSAHHAYDPAGRVLWLGDGRRIASRALGDVVYTFAGEGSLLGEDIPAIDAAVYGPLGMDVGPDGSLYFAEDGSGDIRRITPEGVISTAVSTLDHGGAPADVKVGPDGAVYVVSGSDCSVWRRHQGTSVKIAGTDCTLASAGDGGPATDAELMLPSGMALGPDGSLYVAETFAHRIRRVGLDGIITTIAGTGVSGDAGDGGPATEAELFSPKAVAVDARGIVYIADSANDRIRRITPDGVIHAFAGTGVAGNTGDGGLAIDAQLDGPSELEIGRDGSLYFVDGFNHRIRRITPDRRIVAAAGSGTQGFGGDGGPALQAQFDTPSGLAIAPDGTMYIGDYWNWRVRAVGTALPSFGPDVLAIPVEEDGALYVFDETGRHLRTHDLLTAQPIYTLSYDGRGYLSAIVDSDGNETHIARDASGRPTGITGPYGHVTALTTDADGYLATATDPLGAEWRFDYAAGGLLTSLVDPRGGTHTYAYDADGRLVSDENPAGGSWTLSRNDDGWSRTVTMTTELGRATSHRVENGGDGSHRRVVTMPDGTVAESVRAPDGAISAQYPDGTSISLTPKGDPRFAGLVTLPSTLDIATPGGTSAALGFERQVTLATPRDPLSLVTQTETLTFNGRSMTRVYDAASRTATETSAEGRQLTRVTDARGRETELHLAGFDPVELDHDARGRISAFTWGPRTWSFAYDAQGVISSLTDPLGRVTTYQSDDAEQITRIVLPGGRTIDLTWDEHGNLLSLTPPGRPAHVFSYDAMDGLDGWTAPGGAVTQYDHDVDGAFDRLIRADGAIVDFAYDAAGRLADVTGPGVAISYAYDPSTGHVSANAYGTQNLSYTWDGQFLTTVSWSGPITGSLTRTYDADFRVAADAINGASSISYAYDGDGLMTQAGELSIARAPDTGLAEQTTLNTVVDTTVHNTLGEPTTYEATRGATTLLAFDYTYDATGRIDTRTETIGGVVSVYEYTYDVAGRLTQVRRDGVLVSSYAYDGNDNRTSSTIGGTTVATTVDSRDRLLMVGTTAYTYNEAGELETRVAAGTTSYDHDALGNLIQITLPAGTVVRYVLDGQDRRVGKRVNGALVQGFLYDGRRVAAELTGAGAVLSRFVYTDASHTPAYMVRGGTTYRILADHLGTPRLVVDAATGAIAQRIDYDEYGNVTSDTNPGFQPFGFAGGLRDATTGLVHFDRRDYDPETGRFTTIDPLLFEGGNSNLYAYAFGDPVNLVDPSGELAFLPLLLGAAIGAGGDVAWQMLVEGRSFGCINWGRVVVAGALGAAGGQGVRWFRYGKEFSFGKNFRIAPFGNRNPANPNFIPHRYGRWPHYHRRGKLGPNGQPRPGQGIKRHRPFEPSPHDTSFWDRF